MADFVHQIPMILSLIILDGLLSVDNALLIASMVSHLPEKQRASALRAGLLGAYVLRGLSLLVVELLIANPWVKLLGALYLLYLMFSHLGFVDGDAVRVHKAKQKGFWATVIAVELADLAFSIDNVIASVALSPKLWVVYTGVFIGILAMRFVAGFFVKLIVKFPILDKIAYVLVGAIGVQLVAEHFLHFNLPELYKVASIAGIIVLGLIYDRTPLLKTILGPVFNWLGLVMGNTVELIRSLLLPVTASFELIKSSLLIFWRK